jgi:hypothetical protein
MGRPLEGRGSQKTCLNRGWCSRGYGPTNRSEDKKGESRIDAIGPGFFLHNQKIKGAEMRRLITVFLGLLLLTVGFVHAETVDFEDLTLAAKSYYNGEDGAGGFDSGLARFNNYFDLAWEGFAYSNTTDSATPDWTNQYSAYPGSGAENSDKYGVGYQPGPWGNDTVPTITFPEEIPINRALITNTTYAYFTLKDGNAFTKDKVGFGGLTGDDQDWFLLTITGKDESGNVTDTVDFYLADFRFDDKTLDYIVDAWTIVDLSSLGLVKSIEFALTSSDTDDDPDIGINTPTYFAIDSISDFEEPDDDNGNGGNGSTCFIRSLGM